MGLMERIVIVGTSGSGKTTLAARLAERLDIRHVELDSLHWEPGWREADTAVLQERVEEAVAAGRWIIDGNYSKLRDLTWPKADTLVWLDYRLPRVLWQVTTRTARRVITREELWSGNREGLTAAFSRDSIILWAMTTFRKNRRKYAALLKSPTTAHMQTIRLRSPRRTKAWLSNLP